MQLLLWCYLPQRLHGKQSAGDIHHALILVHRHFTQGSHACSSLILWCIISTLLALSMVLRSSSVSRKKQAGGRVALFRAPAGEPGVARVYPGNAQGIVVLIGRYRNVVVTLDALIHCDHQIGNRHLLQRAQVLKTCRFAGKTSSARCHRYPRQAGGYRPRV